MLKLKLKYNVNANQYLILLAGHGALRPRGNCIGGSRPRRRYRNCNCNCNGNGAGSFIAVAAISLYSGSGKPINTAAAAEMQYILGGIKLKWLLMHRYHDEGTYRTYAVL